MRYEPKERWQKNILIMGKQAQTFELSTNLKLCTIPRVMYCGAIARVIGLRVCAIVHNFIVYGTLRLNKTETFNN